MAFRDYEEFIGSLDAHGVRYLLIGAHAVALHARPRATKDLDVLLDAAPANLDRALAALRTFLGTDLGYDASDLADPDAIVQLGVAPVRIDLVSAIPGCPDFGAAWRRRVDAPFGAVSAHYLGLDDLIRAKRASDRAQDRADVQSLERARRGRRGR